MYSSVEPASRVVGDRSVSSARVHRGHDRSRDKEGRGPGGKGGRELLNASREIRKWSQKSAEAAQLLFFIDWFPVHAGTRSKCYMHIFMNLHLQ